MDLRRAMFIAAYMVPICAGGASAQFQAVPTQPQPQQMPPCLVEFTKLRDDAEKKGMAIRAANQRKASAQEACKLFNSYYAAEGKMMKYATDNQVWCGIPAQILDEIKKSHVRTADIRGKVCQAAAQPQRPAGPSLSDALGAPVPNSGNIKSGRGTFDTLTGTPLGQK